VDNGEGSSWLGDLMGRVVPREGALTVMVVGRVQELAPKLVLQESTTKLIGKGVAPRRGSH